MERNKWAKRRIEFVLNTLMDAADRHQWTIAQACFADEVVLDYGKPQTVAPDSIVRSWIELLPGFDSTKHHITDMKISVKGDLASSLAQFDATHQLHGARGGDTWVLHGRYEHAWQLTPLGWKIARMRMVPLSSEGNEELLKQARQRVTG